MPLAYAFLGIIPLRASARELLYFFLPYYLVQTTVFSWLNRRSRSALLSDVYSFVQCVPLALTVVSAMLNPFAKGFKVTPKGIASDGFSFNWNLGWPLIVLFAATALSLRSSFNIYLANHIGSLQAISERNDLLKGMSLGWIWSAYNLLMLGIALLILVDIPKPDIYEWFNLRRVVQLNVGAQSFWGITTAISESGAEVALTQRPSFAVESQGIKESLSAAEMLHRYADRTSLSQGKINANAPNIATKPGISPALPVLEFGTQASLARGLIDCEAATLEIMEEGCFMTVAKIEFVSGKTQFESGFKAEFPTVRIAFDRLNISQHRRLIEMLYCRPGQWQSQETPGEWRSLWLLLRIAFKPRLIFERNRQVRPIGVSQY
jgi:cellulose synthase (UDP-forming)